MRTESGEVNSGNKRAEKYKATQPHVITTKKWLLPDQMQLFFQALPYGLIKTGNSPAFCSIVIYWNRYLSAVSTSHFFLQETYLVLHYSFRKFLYFCVSGSRLSDGRLSFCTSTAGNMMSPILDMALLFPKVYFYMVLIPWVKDNTKIL